jgi:hypothetical protein
MTNKHLILIAGLILTAVIAVCSPAAAMAAGTQNSAAGTYGGQGNQITPIGGEPSSAGTLPFTGLDLGLLVASGAALIGFGVVIRRRLHHGAPRLDE